MKLKPYPKYKDSGIQWIGEIPEGWEIRKLKYLVKDLSGNGFPEEEQGKDVGDMPFYKVSDINGHEKFVETANNFVSKRTIKNHKWNIIPKYSLIAPKIGEALKKNHRKITKIKCIIDNNCIAFRTFDIDYNYNYYLFNLINFEWFVNPGAVPSLSVEKLRSLIVPLVPLPEQTAIASLLDKKTAEIDALIEKDKKLIALLKEKRTALINHAVTKGLDPNVKLKHSGIQWIGKIPEHWQLVKTKHLTFNLDGKRIPISADLREEGNIPYYGATGILDYVNDYIFNEDLLLIGEDGAPFFEKTKNVAFLISGKSWVNNHAHVLRVYGGINRAWLCYFLNANDYTQYIKGSTRDKLNQDDLSNILVVTPMLPEQNAIANFLDNQTSKIDKTLQKIEEKIKLLEEYKKSLIHYVVTGKVDVRGAS